MPIHFKCPTCKRRLSVGSQKAGREAQCPNCGATIRVPTKEEVAALSAMAAGGGAGSTSASTGEQSTAVFTTFQFDEEPAAETTAPEFFPGEQAASPPPVPPTPLVQPPAIEASTPAIPSQESTPPAPIDPNYLSLSRKVIYAQGILLATVALGCFILGYLSALATGGGARKQAAGEQPPLTVTGRLFYQPRPGQSTPDGGAVMILFPEGAALDERLPVAGLRPEDPPPGNESHAVRVIQSIGGAYVKTNEQGDYKFALPKPGNYRVLRLSRNAARAPGNDPDLADTNSLGLYFSSVANLLGERKYTWSTVNMTAETNLAHDFGVDGG